MTTRLRTTPSVELIDVTRRFVRRAETIVAVDAVSVSVGAGEVVGLAGPSGSGKTTLLNLVLGWERPDDGEVRLGDDVVARRGWSGLGVVPQELGLLPELTAGQNISLPFRLAAGDGVDPAASVADLADRLELSGLLDRLPTELSLGEQQRVAVARAVVAGPALLVADEPTAHQDERRADLVMDALLQVARAGGGVIVATHDGRLLDRVDRAIHLVDGRLVGQRPA